MKNAFETPSFPIHKASVRNGTGFFVCEKCHSVTINRRKLEKCDVRGSACIDALKRLSVDMQKLSRQTKSQQQAETHRLWNC